MATVDVMQTSSPPRQFLSYSMLSSSPPRLPIDNKRAALRDADSEIRVSPVQKLPRAKLWTTATPLVSESFANNKTIECRRLYSEQPNNEKLRSVKSSSLAKTKATVKANKVDDGRKTIGDKTSKESVNSNIPKAKPARKPRTKTTDPGDDVSQEKPARKPRANKMHKASEQGGQIKEKPMRQSRAKMDEGVSQTKISRGQIRKASMISDLEKVTVAPKSKAVVSKHFLPAGTTDSSVTIEPANLKATKRRTDWTPPTVTSNILPTVTPIPLNLVCDGIPSLASGILSDRSSGFSQLFESFGFQSDKGHAAAKLEPTKLAARKRKLVELVGTNSDITIGRVPRNKIPSKKARTITDMAISAFAEQTPTEALGQSAPFLQYLACDTSECRTKSARKAPNKSRSRSPVKAAIKSNLGTAQAPFLLSPGSALKQIVAQDFVFGTSSQLAREDSPTLLRALHQAMQASNESDLDGVSAKSSKEAINSVDTKSQESDVLSSRSLWSAAFRDPNGRLLNVEVVDLAHSPAAPIITRAPTAQDVNVSVDEQPFDEIWHDLDDLDVILPKEGQPKRNETTTLESIAATEDPLNNRVDGATIPKESSIPQISKALVNNAAVSQLQLGSNDRTVKPIVVTKPAKKPQKPNPSEPPAKPDYASYTTVELAKVIASYHFKPVKSRTQMISLLDKCWEGQQRATLVALSTNDMLSTSSNPSKSQLGKPESLSHAQLALPKRPRGRPRKDGSVLGSPTMVAHAVSSNRTRQVTLKTLRAEKTQSKAVQTIDEISDSDTPATPSPPRRRPGKSRVGSLPLSPTKCQVALKLSPKSAQAELSCHISKAVLKEPPTTDISKPSWYEKILLYDPIVLEDLTVWLNTGALEKVGWDGEVGPNEVKKWCESKSICCVWRETNRGGSRVRY